MFEYFILFLLMIIVILMVYNRYNPIEDVSKNTNNDNDQKREVDIVVNRLGVPGSYVGAGPYRWWGNRPYWRGYRNFGRRFW